MARSAMARFCLRRKSAGKASRLSVARGIGSKNDRPTVNRHLHRVAGGDRCAATIGRSYSRASATNGR